MKIQCGMGAKPATLLGNHLTNLTFALTYTYSYFDGARVSLDVSNPLREDEEIIFQFNLISEFGFKHARIVEYPQGEYAIFCK